MAVLLNSVKAWNKRCYFLIFYFLVSAWLFHPDLKAQDLTTLQSGNYSFKVPKEYFEERENIPSFWVTSVDDVAEFLYNKVNKGQIKVIGTSAGGRPIRAVTYGKPRTGEGTTTFSGSLGFRDVGAYRGPDHKKTVYMGMAAVHGGEFEGIVGMVNLISVYKYVHTRLALEGLQNTKDPAVKANPERAPRGVFNLDGALNLHSGALSVVVESPSHSFSGKYRDGKTAFLTPDMLLDSQLICHLEAMRFLAESGGRSKWTPSPKP